MVNFSPGADKRWTNVMVLLRQGTVVLMTGLHATTACCAQDAAPSTTTASLAGLENHKRAYEDPTGALPISDAPLPGILSKACAPISRFLL